MCYSDQLLEKNSAAYETPQGWVYVGYKTVRAKGQLLANKGTPSPEVYYPALYDHGHGFYPMRECLMDKHGYHVAATVDSAKDAAGLLAKPDDKGNVWIRVGGFGNVPRPITKEEARFCRVLVPENAFRFEEPEPDSNTSWFGSNEHAWHAHVIMMIPPNERETEADIIRVAAAGWVWNATYGASNERGEGLRHRWIQKCKRRLARHSVNV